MSDLFWLTEAQIARLIGRTKGGMNTKLHAICDSKGRPINFFVFAGQVISVCKKKACDPSCWIE